MFGSLRIEDRETSNVYQIEFREKVLDVVLTEKFPSQLQFRAWEVVVLIMFLPRIEQFSEKFRQETCCMAIELMKFKFWHDFGGVNLGWTISDTKLAMTSCWSDITADEQLLISACEAIIAQFRFHFSRVGSSSRSGCFSCRNVVVWLWQHEITFNNFDCSEYNWKAQHTKRGLCQRSGFSEAPRPELNRAGWSPGCLRLRFPRACQTCCWPFILCARRKWEII